MVHLRRDHGLVANELYVTCARECGVGRVEHPTAEVNEARGECEFSNGRLQLSSVDEPTSVLVYLIHVFL